MTLRDSDKPGKPASRTETDPGRSPAPSAKPSSDASAGLRYSIEREHARGGLGRILAAHDTKLGRDVAIKELLRGGAAHEARFLREAHFTAQLEHPGIVPVYDADRWSSGEPYYTMKMVSGISLRDAIRDAKTLSERLSLLPRVVDVADAVAYAHSCGVIHRDLKPSNIMLGEFGETLVVDWGLAKEFGVVDLPASDSSEGPYREASDDGLTRAGAVLGTPAYMSPEQAAGQPVEERTDVYALGAILYHTLVGAAPYRGSSSEEIVQHVLSRPPPLIEALEPELPLDLCAIVRKAMARDRADRYASASELADDLKRFQTGRLVGVYGYSRGQLFRRWVARHKLAVAIAAVSALVVVTVGAIALDNVLAARDEATRSAAVAAERLTDSYVEQGRRALLDGDPQHALLYLSEAYSRGVDGRAIRLMLAEAAKPFDALAATFLHKDKLYRVYFDSTGELVITTSAAGADLWDRRSGEHVVSLRGHSDEVAVARISDDGQRVFTASSDFTCRLWSTAGKSMALLEGHLAPIGDARFSPDSTLIATVGNDGKLGMWSAVDGKRRFLLQAHEGHARRVVFSPDGRLVATAGADGVARLWEVTSGRPVRALAGHAGPVQNVAFDRAGERLVTASWDNSAIVWSVSTGESIARLSGHSDWLMGARFSPDGELIVTSGNDPVARVWNASTGALVQELRGHTGAIYWIDFTPDGRRIASVSWDGTARVWDVQSGKADMVIAGHGAPIVWGDLSPDGNTLATASWDGTARIWDVRSERVAAGRLNIGSDVVGRLAFDHAGNKLVASDAAGHLVVFHTRDFRELYRLQTRSRGISAVEFSPDDRVFGTTFDGGFELWASEDGAALRTIDDPQASLVNSIHFADDGETIVTANDAGFVHTWDPTSGRRLRSIQPYGAFAHDAVPSSNRDELLICGINGRAHLVSSDGVERISFAGHRHHVYQARFDPMGTGVLTAGLDGSAILWDASTGARRVTLGNLGAEVFSAEFHPSGELAVTASGDEAVVWDLETGRALVRYRGHNGHVAHALFSPDRSVLATAGPKGVVRIWPTAFETRTPEEMSVFVECHVGKALVDGKVDAVEFDATRCPDVLVSRVPTHQ